MVRKCSKSLIHRNPIHQPVIPPNGEVGKKLLRMENIFVQENNYYCASAIVKSMLQHFGIEKSQSELANELHTSPKTGSEYENIARVVGKKLVIIHFVQ